LRARQVINDLRKAAITADAVYLAATRREGSHSAHLAMFSKPAKYIEQERAFRDSRRKTQTEEPVKKKTRTKPKRSCGIDPKRFSRHLQRNHAKAIRAAFDSPAGRYNLVDAQQARGCSTHCGLQSSPILWTKCARLSRARPTVALRLIVEREC